MIVLELCEETKVLFFEAEVKSRERMAAYLSLFRQDCQ
jgi:hypothetical protein